jgi:uncharacterized circularly permuted ATP-grasp superfamily protein
VEIIKRIDDQWCDPLELNKSSLLGIPGLLQVMRLGNVSVINPPGISVLENHGQWPLFRMLVNFIERTVNYEPLLGGVGKLS